MSVLCNWVRQAGCVERWLPAQWRHHRQVPPSTSHGKEPGITQGTPSPARVLTHLIRLHHSLLFDMQREYRVRPRGLSVHVGTAHCSIEGSTMQIGQCLTGRGGEEQTALMHAYIRMHVIVFNMWGGEGVRG